MACNLFFICIENNAPVQNNSSYSSLVHSRFLYYYKPYCTLQWFYPSFYTSSPTPTTSHGPHTAPPLITPHRPHLSIYLIASYTQRHPKHTPQSVAEMARCISHNASGIGRRRRRWSFRDEDWSWTVCVA